METTTATLPFLQQVARALLAAHGTELDRVAVVLPSQRAGLYLRKWIAAEAGKPLWSPQVFTLASFMEELSGLRPLATEELLFEGYEAYRQAAGQQAQPFGDFLQWAGATLADISEADAHLVPLESYYRDLRNWEEIEWTFNTRPLSEGQQRMVRFWAMAGKLHAALNERLQAMGAGTTGLIERTAVARLGDRPGTWRAAWFAGLNALTPAQDAVLRHFHQNGTARFAWDADRYFLDNPDQEAGLYVRKAIARFGKGVVPPGEHLAAGGCSVRAVRAPSEAAQAWCAAQELAKQDPAGRADTAIVLADEGLLQPLLEALPPGIGPLNITMGLPLAKLPVGAFMQALNSLHAGRRPDAGFFHADLGRFLGHPFLNAPSMAAPMQGLLAAVRGRAWCSADFLRQAAAANGLPPEAAAVFTGVEDVRAEMPAVADNALAWARHAMAGDAFATEQVYQAALVLRRIHQLMQRYHHVMDARSYALLVKRLMGAAGIGFFGEPLAGVQVMGMLEARALDHRNVIVLGAQEGSLPSSAAGRTFIPFELRRAHGMPLREDGDAVQAYNFMRMLQRCSDAVVVWPEGGEPTGPSRFILQLEHEWPQPAKPQRADMQLPMRRAPAARVVVEKDQAVLEALRKRLERGLSPSALGDWLRCPLDFHFKHVMGLRESEDPEARIAPNVLGAALHNAMEAVYGPLLGKPLQAQALEQGMGEVGRLLADELKKGMDAGRLAQGQPLLQVHMAEQAARRFLAGEAETVRKGAVVTVLEQEAELVCALGEASRLVGSPVHIKGRLDRVDRCNGMLRILDLKSGKVNPADLVLRDLEPDALGANKRYAVQLLMYAWLYLGKHTVEHAVQAGLLPLQQVASSKPVFLRMEGRDVVTREDLPAIEKLFTALVQRMMDPEQPIMHDPTSKYCTFCLAAP